MSLLDRKRRQSVRACDEGVDEIVSDGAAGLVVYKLARGAWQQGSPASPVIPLTT